MKRLVRRLVLFWADVLVILALPIMTDAASLAYINTPYDTYNAGLNAVIASVNTNLSPGGAGSISSALTIPLVTNAVNGILLTPSATGGNVTITAAGGVNPDANAPLALASNGTGALLLGGISTTLAGLQVAQTAARVNDVIVTPGATGTGPSILSGGAGADANLGMLVGTVGTGILSLGGPTVALTPLRVQPVASGVNQVFVTGGATGTPATITETGDANRNFAMAAAGTGSLLLGGTTTTVAGLQIAQPASTVNDVLITPGATTVLPTILSGGAGSDANLGMLVGTVGTGSLSLGGPTVALAPLKATPVASGVNQVVVTGAATGNAATITEVGDATRNMAIAAAGSGSLLLGGTTTSLAGLQVAQAPSVVNDVIITPGVTGTAPSVISGGAGSDANIGMLVGTVGTGQLSLGGPTVALTPLKAVPVASGVNQVLITGGATGTGATITEAGDANRNIGIAGAGTGLVLLGQAICTSSGVTPQTCNGQRGIATTNSLSTAAATDASYVINNTSVTTSSLVQCTDEGYSGTLVTNGYPVIETCVPGAGTITVHITNLHAANALAGTVAIGFTVLN